MAQPWGAHGELLSVGTALSWAHQGTPNTPWGLRVAYLLGSPSAGLVLAGTGGAGAILLLGGGLGGSILAGESRG